MIIYTVFVYSRCTFGIHAWPYLKKFSTINDGVIVKSLRVSPAPSTLSDWIRQTSPCCAAVGPERLRSAAPGWPSCRVIRDPLWSSSNDWMWRRCGRALFKKEPHKSVALWVIEKNRRWTARLWARMSFGFPLLRTLGKVPRNWVPWDSMQWRRNECSLWKRKKRKHCGISCRGFPYARQDLKYNFKAHIPGSSAYHYLNMRQRASGSCCETTMHYNLFWTYGWKSYLCDICYNPETGQGSVCLTIGMNIFQT